MKNSSISVIVTIPNARQFYNIYIYTNYKNFKSIKRLQQQSEQQQLQSEQQQQSHGRGKGNKGLGKGGAKRHRKVLRDTINGITKGDIK